MKIYDMPRCSGSTKYLLSKAILTDGMLLVATSTHAEYAKAMARDVFKTNAFVMCAREYLEYLRDNPVPKVIYVDELDAVLENLLCTRVALATRTSEEKNNESDRT